MEYCAACGHEQAFHWDDESPCGCYYRLSAAGRPARYCRCETFQFIWEDEVSESVPPS